MEEFLFKVGRQFNKVFYLAIDQSGNICPPMSSFITTNLLPRISPNWSEDVQTEHIVLYDDGEETGHDIKPGVYTGLIKNNYESHEFFLLVHENGDSYYYCTHEGSDEYTVIEVNSSTFCQFVLSHHGDLDYIASEYYHELVGGLYDDFKKEINTIDRL